jgi:hypothetical protein
MKTLTKPVLRFFRSRPAPSRRVAKTLFWAGGKLSRIKTYQRFYSMEWDGPGDHPRFLPVKRRWSSCRLSMKLLTASMQFDWDHWDNWACQHNDCGGRLCQECGGIECSTGLEGDTESPSTKA